jgi:hypothetical protein
MYRVLMRCFNSYFLPIIPVRVITRGFRVCGSTRKLRAVVNYYFVVDSLFISDADSHRLSCRDVFIIGK